MSKRLFSLALFLVFGFGVYAQAKSMSPSQTYFAYHKAVIAASNPEDITSYHTKEQADKTRALPAKQQAQGLGLVQMFLGEEKDLELVAETISGSKASVILTYCSEGKRGRKEVSMMREGSIWKVGKAHAKTSLKPCN